LLAAALLHLARRPGAPARRAWLRAARMPGSRRRAGSVARTCGALPRVALRRACAAVSGIRHRTLLLAGAVAGGLWLLVSLGCSSGSHAQDTTAPGGKASPAAAAKGAAGTVHHYEYVFPDGSIYVYDMDAGQRLVAHV